MSKRPQFSLKALFIIIVVLAVPLAMLGSGDLDLLALGMHAIVPAVGGSLGYLLGGWKYAILGIGFGLCLAVLFVPALQA